MDPESDDDDDSGEPLTKVEDESEDSEGDDREPPFVDVPSTSADDQPGPSGVGKEGVEAPSTRRRKRRKSALKCVLKQEGADPKPLKSCQFCDKTFSDMRNLNRHVLSHSEERPYSCSLCSRKFKLKFQLAAHTRVHDETMAFECDFCAKKLRSKGSLIIHRRRHLKEYIAKCEVCGQGFVTNQEYSNHMGSRHGISKHICDFCGRSCYDKAALQGHMARHAEDYNTNKSIRCKLCDKTFLQERYLRLHFLRMHKDGGQRFVCDHCGKEVSSKTSLRDHQLIHQGLKPAECKECGRCFALKSTLKLHMRTHTGDRPYECTQCGKSFSQKSPLTVHMRYHTGERPYTCSVCGDGFVSKGALSIHQKKHGSV